MFGKRDFSDLIKLRILTWEIIPDNLELSGIILVGLTQSQGPCKRDVGRVGTEEQAV